MWWFLDLLFPPRPDERLVRAAAADALVDRIAKRPVPVTRPDTTVLLSFADPLARAAIHEAKYHGSDQAFALLAAALSAHLREYPDAVLVPVPLGRARQRERGFNQIEEVPRRANYEFNASILVRTRETASQVSLPREAREANMRGAFGATHSVDPARTYIILDDVVTTGATLQAAIDALSAAGGRDIRPLALAH